MPEKKKTLLPSQKDFRELFQSVKRHAKNFNLFFSFELETKLNPM